MATWVWAVIVIAAVVALAVAVWAMAAQRRTKRLQERFGPEYDRQTQLAGGRREAEAALAAREERRAKLNIRPLSPDARERYASEWNEVQAEFVDAPVDAVARADQLVGEVMSERGYPMDDFDQRAEDISVDHPRVVESYRRAHEIYLATESGSVSTEDERQAMKLYRRLFDELLDGNGADYDQSASGSDDGRRSHARS